MKQLSFTDAESHLKRKQTRKEKFLNKMEDLVPWSIFLNAIEPFYPKMHSKGRQPYPLETMLRVHLMQNWYTMSDPGMEDALYEIASMRQFARLELTHKIPDETTILKFRHLLERNKIQEKIQQALNEIMIEKGMLLKEGTLMDATIVHASPSTKNKSKSRDPEMHSCKKANQYYFGMKAHVGVDMYTGVAHSMTFTSANHHDVTEAHNLLHGEEKLIGGDSGYLGADQREENKDVKAQWLIAERPSSLIKKYGTDTIYNDKKATEKIKAQLRAKVEHIFRIVKCQFGFRKVKYKGLAKNAAHMTMLFTLANIYMMRNL